MYLPSSLSICRKYVGKRPAVKKNEIRDVKIQSKYCISAEEAKGRLLRRQ
jgi:hypothetical protein